MPNNNIEAPVDTLASLSKRDRWKVTTRIRVLVDKNPKKKPSMSYDRFEGYFTLVGDCVVQDALDAGLRMDDIRHDSEHGFIALAEEGTLFDGEEQLTLTLEDAPVEG
jgi:hypothetical protein